MAFGTNLSILWKDIQNTIVDNSTSLTLKYVRHIVGNDYKIIFWYDKWINSTTPKFYFTRLYNMTLNPYIVICDMTVENGNFLSKELSLIGSCTLYLCYVICLI